MEIHFDFDTNIKRSFQEIDPNWEDYPGLVLAGTHYPQIYELDKVIEKIRLARMSNYPVYAECFGHQLIAIEYARNILGIRDATSEEFGQLHQTFIVKKRPEMNVGLKSGESYWNNYEVTIPFSTPKSFFTSQSHPSYQSCIKRPHKLIKSFLEYAKKRT